jgi:hypothetical protein
MMAIRTPAIVPVHRQVCRGGYRAASPPSFVTARPAGFGGR